MLNLFTNLLNQNLLLRIIFKGNISLYDKILIIQTNEDESDEKKGMNGIELYNFKNI